MRPLGIVLTLGGVWLLISVITGLVLGPAIGFGMRDDAPAPPSRRCSG